MTKTTITIIIVVMDNSLMTLAHLDTLSSADLISLADQYGVDIPEDLNRRFIIAELLDIARVMREDITMTYDAPEAADLPPSYNETAVSAVPSNPVWLYVYWDISASDNALLTERAQPALILRVAVNGADGKVSPSESFDVPVNIADTDQFILLPASAETVKTVRVELILETLDEKPRLLAFSGSVPLSRPCPDFRESFLGVIPPLLELSGFRELMRTHFLRHRQSFS